MTLREFTKEFLPLPDAEYGPNNPAWRKVFPTNLRWHKIIDIPGRYKLFSGWQEEEFHLDLMQEWERVHKGEIINTEWRKLYIY